MLSDDNTEKTAPQSSPRQLIVNTQADNVELETTETQNASQEPTQNFDTQDCNTYCSVLDDFCMPTQVPVRCCSLLNEGMVYPEDAHDLPDNIESAPPLVAAIESSEKNTSNHNASTLKETGGETTNHDSSQVTMKSLWVQFSQNPDSSSVTPPSPFLEPKHLVERSTSMPIIRPPRLVSFSSAITYSEATLPKNSYHIFRIHVYIVN